MATAHAWVVFRSLGTSHGQPIQYMRVFTLCLPVEPVYKHRLAHCLLDLQLIHRLTSGPGVPTNRIPPLYHMPCLNKIIWK